MRKPGNGSGGSQAGEGRGSLMGSKPMEKA